MKLPFRNDVEDIAIWIVCVSWLFALAYVGNGGQNILINLFAVLFTIALAIGLLKSISESLEDYYWKKREARKRQV